MASAKKYLITGGAGQLGGYFAKFLRAKVGRDNVIVTDIKDPYPALKENGPYMKLDVLNHDAVTKVIKENKITSVLHMAALLSASCETNLPRAFDLNIHFFTYLFLLAKEMNLQIYCPSTLGTFGPESELEKTPDLTIQRPKSLYGVGKVYVEILGEYFNAIHGVDFRCLRYPGMISHQDNPGASTNYPAEALSNYFKTKSYACYIESDVRMPYAYVEDCMENTVKFILTPNEKLKQRVYNYRAYSMSPATFFEAAKKTVMPDLQVSYKVVPSMQNRVKYWSRDFDISSAERDWKPENRYTLEQAITRAFNVYKEQNQK